MANPNVLFSGFVPLNARETDLVVLEVQSNNSAAIYPGEPVVAQTDGSVLRTAAGGGAGSTAIVTEILGYKDAAGFYRRNAKYIPASTTWTNDNERTMVLACLVSEDMRFKVRANAAVASLAAARTLRWSNCDHVYGTADTGLGLSGIALDVSTINTTNTLQWRILDGLLDVAQNNPTLTNFSLIVCANVAPVGLPPVKGGSATGV